MTKSLILLMAGKGQRTNLNINKTLYKINNIPLFLYSLNTFMKVGFDEYIVVCSENDYNEVLEIISDYGLNVKIVKGKSERNGSVKEGLKKTTSDVAFIHDAARPLISVEDIRELMKSSKTYLCGTLYHDLTDTLRTIKNPISQINRNTVKGMSTPQFFNKCLFEKILNNEESITDEISLFENDMDIAFVKETKPNLKLTTANDLEYICYLLSSKNKYLIGHSLDYHPFGSENGLVLGGVHFNDYPILLGHSDADVIFHVVVEAIMGALGIGDLGTLFPDSDMKYKGMDSSYFIKEVIKKVILEKAEIVNIDVMVYLIKPYLKDYKKEMIKNIKELTGCNYVCVKAATLNKHGLIALEEGIGAEATILMKI